jgi:hypothetical protein
MTIHDAWYQAAKDAFKNGKFGYTIKYIVAGDNSCFNDKVATNATPTGTWHIDDPTQVFP